MEEEIWKDIPGYEGLYQCSNFGRIKSFYKSKNGILLKFGLCGGQNQYYRVILCKNNIKKQYTVHKLVFYTFNGVINSGLTIDHINGNSFDNKLSNLRICNIKDNINNPNSSIIKSCRIYFNNGEIKDFPSTYSADEYINAPKHTISLYIRNQQKSPKYGFKKAEYI